MQIKSVQTNQINTYQQNFEGRYFNLLTKSSGKKIPPLDKIKEQIIIGTTYNKLWDDLKLPIELKPKLVFDNRDPYIDMGFNKSTYEIFVNNGIDTFEMHLKNKTGRNKECLRHEIEHVKQIWDIIRLNGAENCIASDTSPRTKHIARKIEKTLGRITEDSPEKRRAEKYTEAALNYPNMQNNNELDPLYYLEQIEYHFNDLEIAARKSEKEVRLDLITKIKRTIFEYVKDYKRQQQKL